MGNQVGFGFIRKLGQGFIRKKTQFAKVKTQMYKKLTEGETFGILSPPKRLHFKIRLKYRLEQDCVSVWVLKHAVQAQVGEAARRHAGRQNAWRKVLTLTGRSRICISMTVPLAHQVTP